MHVKWSSGRDIAVSLFILLGLAVPFVPVPGDRETQMEVRSTPAAWPRRMFSARKPSTASAR